MALTFDSFALAAHREPQNGSGSIRTNNFEVNAPRAMYACAPTNRSGPRTLGFSGGSHSMLFIVTE
jgi:hypothetical protein